MTITVNTKAYNLDVASGNTVRFLGPGHSFQAVDSITFARTAPKPTKDFAGVSRAVVKLTRTVPTGTDQRANIILGGDTHTIPVGATEADVTAALADYAALMADVSVKAFVAKHIFPK